MRGFSQVIINMLRIKGLCAPTFTPMAPNGTVQLSKIADYVRHLANHNVPNIFVGGTSSEFSCCTVTERKAINEEWIRQGRAHLEGRVIVQVGASALGDVQELAKHAVQAGADAIACVSPFYLVPSTLETMVDFFKAVTEVVPDTPFFYYHIPMLTHCPVDLTEFLRAACKEIPTLTGMKYTDNDMQLLRSLQGEFGDRLQLMNGFENHYLEALKMGVEEGVHACFNFMPGPFLRMRQAVAGGDMAAAEHEHELICSVFDLIGKYSANGIICSLKDTAAAATGLDLGPARLPLRSGGQARSEILKAELRELGFFERQY